MINHQTTDTVCHIDVLPYGTLMTAIRCRDGFVVAADRLVTFKTSDLEMEKTKLFHSGRNMVFVVTGAQGVMGENCKWMVDFELEIKNFCNSNLSVFANGNVTQDLIAELASYLESKFKYGINHFPLSPGLLAKYGEVIFRIWVYANNTYSQNIEIFAFQLRTRPDWTLRTDRWPSETAFIIDGHDRGQKIAITKMKDYYGDLANAHAFTQEMSKTDAKRLANTIFIAAHEFAPHSVGKSMDVYFLSPLEGVQLFKYGRWTKATVVKFNR